MIDKKELMRELEKDFEAEKKDLGFNLSFDEFDSNFNFRNVVLNKGFVPYYIKRGICSIIGQEYRDWYSYLNSLLLPNGSSYASQTEAKLFSSESDKKAIWALIKKCMDFSSRSSYVLLLEDKKLIAEFIDESFNYWVSEFKPRVMEIMRRVNGAWREN